MHEVQVPALQSPFDRSPGDAGVEQVPATDDPVTRDPGDHLVGVTFSTSATHEVVDVADVGHGRDSRGEMRAAGARKRAEMRKRRR
jgi:hypothetical protein